MSPDRQEGVDRLRWTAWGVVAALALNFLSSARGWNQTPTLPGTEIPSLLTGLFVIPAGALLGFGLATWRNHVATGTDVDRPADGNDAAGPDGTD
ncbi:MAG: hypothetical protein AAF907_11980 [Planctomycetota bacterium]